MPPEYKVISNNHEITVSEISELYGEKGNFRVMQFSNAALQGALDLNEPDRIVFEYPRVMIHLMECNDASFENVFVIGHGIGTIASHFPEKRFKIAEVDHNVVDLSRRYFGYSMDNVMIGDGRHILEGEDSDTYDYIILDAFNSKGTPQHLISQEFFKITADKLTPQGSIIINLMGRGENDSLINAIHSTLRQVYTYTLSFILPGDRFTDVQNMIMIGRNIPIRFQARQMAGFIEMHLGTGHIILDY
ncbi:hypothetical protein JCM16418A_13600 [Paenibacillus pini]|uniref:Spermine/spermidine synthase protein n=1 Tax=Paenibacillus pini JCM 16418 TaxID=1236976 RepID=W7Y9F7_9BACL|nr:spermine/spermidine synthase protein [Paenibacillus pini JCM 16418]